jgi:hypothetical protein
MDHRTPINRLQYSYGGFCGHSYLNMILHERKAWLLNYKDKAKRLIRKQLEIDIKCEYIRIEASWDGEYEEKVDKVVEKMYKVDLECINFFIEQIKIDDEERPPYLNPIVFSGDVFD